MGNKTFNPAVGVEFLRTELAPVVAESNSVSMDQLLSGKEGARPTFSPTLGSSALRSQLCNALGISGMQDNFMKLVNDEVSNVGHYKFKVIASDESAPAVQAPSISRPKSMREKFKPKFLSMDRVSPASGVRNVNKI